MALITRSRLLRAAAPAAALALAAVLLARAPAEELHPKLKALEEARIAVIAKVKPSVVSVFGPGGNGGGSGVLIDAEGYALTNFHVTAGAGNVMKCGLPDGIMYDAVLVGHDKVGDVALIKLLPKKEGQKFPFAPLGDSDKVRPGDWSLAMGNPFLLATDFTPTVTFGLISGVHRYQYPDGGKGLLEYTDCIQIDTSINPGNSGGPLFNMRGELIGINGRGSFDKRTRINSGVGYAISINQIKNFLGHLRAGLDVDHATTGFLVESEGGGEDVGIAKMVVQSILTSSDAARRGMDIGDELVSFAGRPTISVNHYKNALGLYPRGWRVPLVYRRDDEKKEVLIRLMGVQPRVIDDGDPMPRPAPRPRRRPRPAGPPSPALKLFEAKAGFANHYFNKQERKRLWDAFVKGHGDFSGLRGEWVLKAGGEADGRPTTLEVSVKEDGAPTKLTLKTLGIEYNLVPLKSDVALRDQAAPPKSGGLISAMYLYRQLLTKGEEGFTGGFAHGGRAPFYLPPPNAGKPDYSALRVMAEVLNTSHGGVEAKWYFSLKDQRLLGAEVWIDEEQDPCEVFFSEYKDVGGRKLPARIQVRHGDENYADYKNVDYQLAPGK